MDSWWELGEWYGNSGDKFDIHNFICPFCDEKGNFNIEHHAEKKKPQDRKIINFDTLKCGDCASYVMVMWSNSRRGNMHGMRAMPWSLKIKSHPKEWPADIGRYWLQAKRSLNDENWDAAAVMARSALQLTLRAQNAQGKNLYGEINDLAAKGLLPPTMKDWAHNLRELGNDSAHPRPNQAPTVPADARDICNFLDFLLEYLYTLPHRISKYHERKNS